jgi:hypothetical protein
VGNPNDIAKIMLYQDCLDCVEHQGRQMGPKSDQKELDKIASLRDAAESERVTKDMLVNFGFAISPGTHEYIASADSEAELIRLCDLMEALHIEKDWKGTKAGDRFEEILEELRKEDLPISDSLHYRINQIQFIL